MCQRCKCFTSLSRRRSDFNEVNNCALDFYSNCYRGLCYVVAYYSLFRACFLSKITMWIHGQLFFASKKILWKMCLFKRKLLKLNWTFWQVFLVLHNAPKNFKVIIWPNLSHWGENSSDSFSFIQNSFNVCPYINICKQKWFQFNS